MKTKMTQAGLLKDLEELGRRIAMSADPVNYSAEYNHQAAQYEKPLKAARKVYRVVRNTQDARVWLRELEALSKNTCDGIHTNYVRLLIFAVRGDYNDSTEGWCVVDGHLEYVSEGRKVGLK